MARTKKIKLPDSSLHKEHLFQFEALKKLFENTPTGIILVDNQRIIKDVNKFILEAFPYSKYEDLVGKHISVLSNYTGLTKEQSPIIEALKGKKSSTMLDIYARKILLNTYPVKNEQTEEILGAIIIGQDITELDNLKRELERLDRLNLIGKMAASLAHEIRNPLTVIRGFTQLLLSRADEESKNMFRVILEELDGTNNVIENFLSLSKNKFIRKEKCNLNKTIKDSLIVKMIN